MSDGWFICVCVCVEGGGGRGVWLDSGVGGRWEVVHPCPCKSPSLKAV